MNKLILSVIFVFQIVCSVKAQTGAVIVNLKNPVSSMTSDEVRLIYTQKQSKHWPNRQIIQPVDTETITVERKNFYQQVLKTRIEMAERYFLLKQYQGEINAPTKVESDEAVIKYVSANPGAIGFISQTAVPLAQGVKIVLSF